MVNDLLRKGLKLSHLRLLAALGEDQRLSAAAQRLGISQPAASRLGAEMERILGAPVYLRSPTGVALTMLGVALVRRAQRILLEIELADREVRELAEGLAGQVRVGSVTGPAVEYLLPVLRGFRLSHPRVRVAIDVGTSTHLIPELLDGRLDFALARLPAGQEREAFDAEPMGTEPIAFAVRLGHPLAARGKVGLKDLMPFDWALPFDGTILRDRVEAAISDKGLAMPGQIVSTSSFLMTLALVGRTNAVAPLAQAVVEAFGANGICALDLDQRIEVGTYALITRRDMDLTPAAAALADLLRRQAAASTGPSNAA